jgi:hypothetical protein
VYKINENNKEKQSCMMQKINDEAKVRKISGKYTHCPLVAYSPLNPFLEEQRQRVGTTKKTC